MSVLSPDDAILHAANNEPIAVQHEDSSDPQGLVAGMHISVSPDLDGGEQPVEGKLVSANSERVIVRRTVSDVGNINVHFPRLGYRITTFE